jgi:hypothetical protein
VELTCGHFDDTRRLAIQPRSGVRAALGQRYLTESSDGTLRLKGEQLKGRLEENVSDLSAPPLVVVDGDAVS